MSTVSDWFTAESVEAAKQWIGPCPREVLEMVAALMMLEDSTRDHAIELHADGFVFRADEANTRADNYRDSIKALVAVWGEPENEDE